MAEILESAGPRSWIVTEVQPQTEETFHQDHRGRPGKDTRYVKKVATRFDLSYRIDDARVAADAPSDGIFPLVTNVAEFSALELLHAYKRQPAIEKRFSQLKTDFEVAPVYLKAVHRIQALLCMYFFALLIEALLERQLRPRPGVGRNGLGWVGLIEIAVGSQRILERLRKALRLRAEAGLPSDAFGSPSTIRARMRLARPSLLKSRIS